MRVRYRIGSPGATQPAALHRHAQPTAPLPAASIMAAPPELAELPAWARPTPARTRWHPRNFHLGRCGVAAAALLAAAGCATLDPGAAKSWNVQPVLNVTHSIASSEGHYRVGRYHDGMGQWDKAIESYRKALGADARNVDAHNALGVALAQRGSYADADTTLRHALALDPTRADVRSNLGYVLMLAGRPQAAVVELQAALELDRANPVSLGNLREASARAGGTPGVTVHAAPPPPISAPAAAPPAPMQVIDQPTIASLQPAVTPVHAPPPSAAASPPAVPTAHADGKIEAQLEVSNGNGVAGMGARLRDWLAGQGVRTGRLSNQRPFVQEHTAIQYRAGHADAAQRVVDALPAALRATPTLVPGLRSDVRVVLGRDWVHNAACLQHDICKAGLTTVAAVYPSR